MQDNFDKLISELENKLPELVTPEHLLKMGFCDNHTMLFRLRQSGEIPFLKLSNARILYLKQDVITWLKNSYHKRKESQVKENEHVISA